MISRLIPLPIPYSSICSPIHIRKIVPAVMIQTHTNPGQKPRYAGSTTFMFGLIMYCTQKALWMAHRPTVAYLVYSLMRFRPLSPSFIMASSEGTTLPRSWKMIEAEIYGMIPRPKIVLMPIEVPPNIATVPNTEPAAPFWPSSQFLSELWLTMGRGM